MKPRRLRQPVSGSDRESLRELAPLALAVGGLRDAHDRGRDQQGGEHADDVGLGAAGQQRRSRVGEDARSRRRSPRSGAGRRASRRSAAGRRSRRARCASRRRRSRCRDEREVGDRPGEEEVLAPARSRRSPRRELETRLGAGQRTGEQQDDRPAVLVRPTRRARRRARSGSCTRLNHTPSRTERSRNCRNESSASGLLHRSAIRGHRHLTAAVERPGARLRCRGCARWPSGRSCSPPTRPRSGSTPWPAATTAATSRATSWSPSRWSSDRDIDLTTSSRSRAYADFHDGPLSRQGAGHPRPQHGAAGHRLRAADRARLRARRGDTRSSCSWRRSPRSASCSRRAGRAADRAGAVGERRARCWSGCHRSRSRTRPRSTPRPRRGRR